MPEAILRISRDELRRTPCRDAGDPHLLLMRKPRRSSPFALPMMMARLAAASLETIFHRTTMMAKGTCTPAEYRRMVAEKATAAQHSMMALMTGKSLTSALVHLAGKLNPVPTPSCHQGFSFHRPFERLRHGRIEIGDEAFDPLLEMIF
jgi:hypothetical protein